MTILLANQSSLLVSSKVLLANSTTLDGRWWMREEFLLVGLIWFQRQLRLPHYTHFSLVLCCLETSLFATVFFGFLCLSFKNTWYFEPAGGIWDSEG